MCACVRCVCVRVVHVCMFAYVHGRVSVCGDALSANDQNLHRSERRRSDLPARRRECAARGGADDKCAAGVEQVNLAESGGAVAV